MGAIAELRAAGKIRHVGLSNVSTAQLAVAQGIVPVVSVQNRYNLADRKSEDVLAACEAQGIGFIPYAPILHGSGNEKLSATLADVAAVRGGVTEGRWRWRGCWRIRRVMLPIPGTGSVAHLEENMVAAELKLLPEEMSAIEEAAAK